jgi:hypothetical protein
MVSKFQNSHPQRPEKPLKVMKRMMLNKNLQSRVIALIL